MNKADAIQCIHRALDALWEGDEDELIIINQLKAAAIALDSPWTPTTPETLMKGNNNEKENY